MRSFVILIAFTIFNVYSAFANPDLAKQPDSTYTFGAFDKTSGKRLAATFKIYYKNSDPLVIQGTLQSDVQFKPATKGQYEVEISMPNYVSKRIPLNLENLGAGKTNFKELLEVASDEFTILVTDAKDKQIIMSAKVKVYDDAKKEVEAKVNPKTGEWKVMMDISKNYHIEIEAPGYQGVSSEVEGVDITKTVKTPSKFISVSLQKNNSQVASFIATDANTHEPLVANYKVLRPEETTLTGQSNKNEPYRVEFNPKKKFTVEVSAEGYKTVTELISFDQTMIERGIPSALLKKIELQRDTYNFLFKIIDAQTKANIISTRMRIINLNNKQSIAGKIEKEGFSANLSPDTEYSIEVESEGYEQANQNINLKDLIARNQFVQEILLNKKSIEQYRLIVVDEENDKNVPGANLRVFNARNEPITIATTNIQSEWLADLKIGEQYNAEVKTQGYLAYRAPILKSNKTVYLKIRKVPANDIYFMVVDFYTKNILPSDYKLRTGTALVEGSVNPEKTRFKATLTPDKSYEIEVLSQGYPAYKEMVNLTKVVNNVITFELKKTGYDFIFNPIDSKTKEPIPNVKIGLNDSNNQTVAVTANVAKMVSPQSFGKKYSLNAQVANYKVYTENIDLMNMAVANFRHDIVMEKIEVTQAPPPIVEKPKTEEKLIAKKEEEAPVASVVAPVEPEKKEPVMAKVSAIADDYFKGIEVGKPIKLENVYFDQSQPIIKPQSYSELDRLVNLLKHHPKMSIEVIGHTDNVGDPRMNLYLSELRAKAVSNYLFNKGISPDRLTHKGKGQEQPVSANDTEENRQKNRRVEFVVTEYN
ncbi:OmpA family protein [Emticicia sp. BO119]|uniref:OmpA family protein n=1 Tax=Emticicia sp. BO119 TaxID=2757768 RepID=UPI0015F04DA4|nr:OmpA family protein [Emticicia sp. BO119]MBA4849916.1 OmpA family protein [Emticicia sp. BO119]